LTSLQALLRLASLRWLGVFVCALATLLSVAGTASALEPAQTKTRVWGFDFAEHNSVGLFGAATSGKHQGNRLARAEEASGSLLAARGARLANDAVVCRGGTCTAERFASGSGVTLDSAGRLQGASVNSAPGAALEQLTSTIPNKQVGVTTVGQIRALGGDVIPSATRKKPFHCTLCSITPQQAEQLFTPTIRNPSVP